MLDKPSEKSVIAPKSFEYVWLDFSAKENDIDPIGMVPVVCVGGWGVDVQGRDGGCFLCQPD
jgi:hypothetical protein